MKRSTFILVLGFSAAIIVAIVAPVSIIYASVRNDKNPVTPPPENETENQDYNLTNETDNLPNNNIDALQPNNNQQNPYIAYLNSVFSELIYADPDRCRNGYAPVCGDCWCGMDDNEQNTTCPPFPDGFVDGCTDTERRLRLLSTYKKYVREEVPDDYLVAHLNADRLPSLRPMPTDSTELTSEFRMSSPLVIDVSENRDGTNMMACNPFGDVSDLYNNPFKDLPRCFSFPGERSDNVYNESEAVCAFKITGTTSSAANDLDDIDNTLLGGACSESGETLYVLQTLSSADSAVNNTNLQIAHHGSCGQCSTAQDFAAFLDNPDSFYASSVACIIGSVMSANPGTIDGDSTLFPVYYSCYRELGMSEGCSFALASVIFGTSFFCDEGCASSFLATSFQGDSRYWLGGPPPTCKKHGCDTCIDNSNMFGLSSIVGAYHQTGRSISGILVDHPYKCQNVKGVDTDILILDPCGDFGNT